MTKEELKKEAKEYAEKHFRLPSNAEEGYLAGAEPREKRIVELEQKLEQTEKDLADYQFNYPTIKELEKENAELKENNKLNKNTWYNDRLKEAKEIIEDLLDTQYVLDPYLDIYKDRIIRAEKFIKFVKGE